MECSCRLGTLLSQGRRCIATRMAECCIEAATQFRPRDAQQVYGITGGFEVRSAGTANIIQEPNRRDEQRTRNGHLPARDGIGVLVVQAILARDKGRAIVQSAHAAALECAHQAAQPVRVGRIAPAKVVQDGYPIRIGADADDVSHRFIDG